MTFKEITHILYRFMANGRNQSAFVEGLLLGLIEQDPEDNVLDYSATSYRRFFNGRSIKELAKKIGPFISKPSFEEYLEDELNEDVIPVMVKEFCDNGCKMNEFNYSETIADLLVDIILSNPESKSANSTTVINNSYISQGALSAEEVANTPIEELNDKPIRRLNTSVSIANTLASAKLPDELKPYYEVKLSSIGDSEPRFMVVAKSEEAYNKYPQSITYHFSSENNDMNRLKDIQSLINEANRTNHPVALGYPSKIVEKIGNYINPLPQFSDANALNSMVYVNPEADPVSIRIRHYMSNSFCQLKLDGLTLHLLEQHEDFVRFSNVRDENAWFTYELDLWKTKVAQRLLPREGALENAESFLDYFKYKILTKDKTTYARLTADDLSRPIVETTSAGNYEFSNNEIKNLASNIELLNKLIEIEDQLNMKFKISLEELSRNDFAVELLYYCIKKKKKSFKARACWRVSFKDPVDETDYKVGTVLKDGCNELSFIDVFNERIPIDGIKVSFKNATVIQTDVIENQFSVIVATDHSKIIPIE